MNDDTHLAVQPEVSDFVARVRARLGDLTEEEREELVGGLEADLSERLDDVGPGGLAEDLGDPVVYAAELRAAAGLEARGRRRRRQTRPLREDADALLDAARVRWHGLVSSRPWACAWDTVVPLRPVWWALRGWVAVQLLDAALGPSEYLTVLPSLGAPLVGPVLLLVAVWASVQLGNGKLWPGVLSPLGTWARVALLVLNVFAVAMLGAVLNRFPDTWISHDLANGAIFAEANAPEGSGLRSDGHYVRNVFAYDSDGRPLTGVQLYDAKGRPLAVTRDLVQRSYQVDGAAVWTYPWFNGSQPLLNVFPLPVRRQQYLGISTRAWDSARPPELPAAPLAEVPPVALPTRAAVVTPDPSVRRAGPAAGRARRDPAG